VTSRRCLLTLMAKSVSKMSYDFPYGIHHYENRHHTPRYTPRTFHSLRTAANSGECNALISSPSLLAAPSSIHLAKHKRLALPTNIYDALSTNCARAALSREVDGMMFEVMAEMTSFFLFLGAAAFSSSLARRPFSPLRSLDWRLLLRRGLVLCRFRFLGRCRVCRGRSLPF
jgi:hypothetical protein